METRRLGRTDLFVSSCCLGTMTWGQQNTEAEAFAQMDYALERGVNFWDTAELYPVPARAETSGRTEDYIGNWFASRGRRDAVILATKVAGRSSHLTWFRDDKSLARVTPAQIDEAVEKSLRRLKTDYIDLYQIHWPDRNMAGFGYFAYQDYDDDYVAFEDQLSALTRHVDKGNIRHIGVSNESAWGVMQFLRCAEKNGVGRLVSIQNAYSLINRTFEYGLAEVAMREDVGLLAYSPLAQGHLSGKYVGGATPADSRKALHGPLMARYERPGAESAIEAYTTFAKEHGIDPAQLAIRFCDTRPFVTATIIGASQMSQLKTNIDSFALKWTDELETGVNDLHAQHRSPCP